MTTHASSPVPAEPIPPLPPKPWPTEQELEWDGDPMPDNIPCGQQMQLLHWSLSRHWANRTDVVVGSDAWVYYRPDQAAARDFVGPDVYVVTGVVDRDRLGWVIWEEGKAPDVVIELLSPSTARADRTRKKAIYQDEMQVPVYVWYDIQTGEWAGWLRVEGVYQPIPLDEQGRMPIAVIGLYLVVWEGVYERRRRRWLRWADTDGTILPTGDEAWLDSQREVERERRRAEEQRRRAEEQRRRAEEQRRRAEEQMVRAEQEHTRAEEERLRAEQEHMRAEQERERAESVARENAELRRRLEELERLGRSGHT